MIVVPAKVASMVSGLFFSLKSITKSSKFSTNQYHDFLQGLPLQVFFTFAALNQVPTAFVTGVGLRKS